MKLKNASSLEGKLWRTYWKADTPLCGQRSIQSKLWLFQLSCMDVSSVQFSCSVISDSLQPLELQHTRLPCLSPTPGACPNSCPSSQWHHPTISSSVVPFSSSLQSFPAQGLFQWVSSLHEVAKILELQFQHQSWLPLGWTGLISLQSKGLSAVFSFTTVKSIRSSVAGP